MALHLEILARIGTYLGFGSDRADRDAQERSNEHNTSQNSYSGDDHRGQDGPHEKASGNHTPAGDHGGGDSQNSEYTNTDYQNSNMAQHNDTYGGQHGKDFDPPLSGAHFVSSEYDYINDNSLDNDEDLHAVLAALPDTGAMLDAAISYLDSGMPCDFGSVDVTPFDDHGGSSSIT